MRVLSRMFRGKLLAFLKLSYRHGELCFACKLAELSTPRTFYSLLGTLRRREWVVYSKPPFGGPEHVLKYLARYTHRVAISNGRLLSLDNGQVRFRWRDSRHGNRSLTTYHMQAGFGVPVVVMRKAGCCPRRCQRYLSSQFPFAATVVLRPADAGNAEGGVLEFYNPLKVSTVSVCGQPMVMARDVSAPIARQLQIRDRAGILGFLDPSLAERGDGLRFAEPYQAGKIPVVFVHGLLSDPATWFDVANDLRAQPWFNERYQIWAFSYATGEPFITSATLMRTQCREAVALLDPEGQDPALHRMVLVGHSMGGLVCKLQVTYSEEQIWKSFSNIPFECLRAKPEMKARLAERCFFDPQPFVRRVVFIATPHDGSSLAARGIGRLSSRLVEPIPQASAAHAELVADNPGAFTDPFERHVPTSVEMLEPQDPTLQAIRTLRFSPCVKLHSVIGTGHPSLRGEPGDGVVPVASACHPGVEGPRFVDATHSSILRDPKRMPKLNAHSDRASQRLPALGRPWLKATVSKYPAGLARHGLVTGSMASGPGDPAAHGRVERRHDDRLGRDQQPEIAGPPAQVGHRGQQHRENGHAGEAQTAHSRLRLVGGHGERNAASAQVGQQQIDRHRNDAGQQQRHFRDSAADQHGQRATTTSVGHDKQPHHRLPGAAQIAAGPIIGAAAKNVGRLPLLRELQHRHRQHRHQSDVGPAHGNREIRPCRSWCRIGSNIISGMTTIGARPG